MKIPDTLNYDGKTLRRVDRAPLEMRGGRWHTYLPDPDDGSIYERDERSGRVLKTMEEDTGTEPCVACGEPGCEHRGGEES